MFGQISHFTHVRRNTTKLVFFQIRSNFSRNCDEASSSSSLYRQRVRSSRESRRGIGNPTTNFRRTVGQNLQKCQFLNQKRQFSNSHISPNWGPIPTIQKPYVLGSHGLYRAKVRRGCAHRKGVYPTPKLPHPQICDFPKFDRMFLETVKSDLAQIFNINRGP